MGRFTAGCCAVGGGLDCPTGPVYSGCGKDAQGVRALPAGGGTVAGDSPGLYADVAGASMCDREHLISYLMARPKAASVWASIRGIRPDDISAYIRQLTPAVLRSDTFVTNYGYDNGVATKVPAVLQAGTAVLVDNFGAPVTKCLCGNPLTGPEEYQQPPSLEGQAWPSFSQTNITIVQPSPVVINKYVMIDI